MKPVWQLYAYLPPALDGFVDRCFRYLIPLTQLRAPVVIIRGLPRSGGPPAVVVIAGAGQGIDYLVDRFFDGDLAPEAIGKVPLWRLARTLKRLQASVDMTIARVDRVTARLSFDSDYLAVPEWVGTCLPLPREAPSYALKRQLQRALRSDFSSELTRTQQDFETFYDAMYVPFIRKRYGEQAAVRRFYSMRRLYRHGGLIWLKQGGERVAGLMFHKRLQKLEVVALGTINGEWAPVEAGAFARLYSLFIEHAETIDCTEVEMGGCRPSLNDGVLRYKRKWGAHLAEQRGSHYDFMVHWNRSSQPVIDFLTHTPMIFRDYDGLSAITGMDPGEPTQIVAKKAHGSQWMRGLRRMYFVTASGQRAVQESALGTVSPEHLDARQDQTLGFGRG